MLLQVVLPDPSNADKDTVVFLDKAQAAATSEEAQERAAVAALARVAGHRNMQRVLPQAFQPAWAWCVQQVRPPAASHTHSCCGFMCNIACYMSSKKSSVYIDDKVGNTHVCIYQLLTIMCCLLCEPLEESVHLAGLV